MPILRITSILSNRYPVSFTRNSGRLARRFRTLICVMNLPKSMFHIDEAVTYEGSSESFDSISVPSTGLYLLRITTIAYHSSVYSLIDKKRGRGRDRQGSLLRSPLSPTVWPTPCPTCSDQSTEVSEGYMSQSDSHFHPEPLEVLMA